MEKNKSLQKNEYFVKNHNTKVMSVLDSKIVEKEIMKKKNRIKFIEKIGNSVNFRMIKKFKKVSKLAFLMLVHLTVNAKINQIIGFKKVRFRQSLRIRSRKLLAWLVSVLRIVGKIQKKLKKIRRRVAYKNIKGIVDPVIRFVGKSRKRLHNTLYKVVKKIQYVNLIFLLYSKWKNYIELIQKHCRIFLKIKKARVEGLIKYYDKNGSGCKLWTSFKPNQKKDFVEKFLKIVLHAHSKTVCKYHSENKPILKKFSRNMFFIEKSANSEFTGRKIFFATQKKPVFKLFSNKNQIMDYLNSYDRVLKRKLETRYQKIIKYSKMAKKA